MKIEICGWIDYPHSYSIVTLSLLVALRKIDGIEIWFREAPKYLSSWQKINTRGIVVTAEEQEYIDNLPRDCPNPDLIFRISFPYDISVANGTPVVVFYTAEFGVFQKDMFINGSEKDFKDRCTQCMIYAATPSKWSASAYETLVGQKAFLLPHGVDTLKYYSNPESVSVTKDKLGIPHDSQVLLAVGAMTSNKGIHQIILNHYKITLTRPDVFIVLKGLEMHNSNKLIQDAIDFLSSINYIDSRHWNQVCKNRIIIVEETLSFEQMRCLYNVADVLLSPYIAEGFNLPVLESIACGTGVIVSKGGSTDDFTNRNTAKYPHTSCVKMEDGRLALNCDSLSLHDKILEALDDKGWQHQMVEQSKSVLSWNIVAEQFVGLARYIRADFEANGR